MRSSIVQVYGDIPVRAAGRQLREESGARGCCDRSLSSGMLGVTSPPGLAGRRFWEVGHVIAENTARCCRAEWSVSVLRWKVVGRVVLQCQRACRSFGSSKGSALLGETRFTRAAANDRGLTGRQKRSQGWTNVSSGSVKDWKSWAQSFSHAMAG
jgi:hypothetical protein